jgi:MFS family permease
MKRILPVIVLSQFFCTSLWFAGNAIMGDIARQFRLEPGYLAHLASAVQSGFITGTLVFAILSFADRFSPSKVFFSCAIVAALINLGISFNGINSSELITLRFMTGFFLAGIYPVGMKIAADHYQQGLGKSLGFLVGALVLGTAFPHLLKSMTATLPWKYVIYTTSSLSALGGLAMFLFVPDGPYRKPGQQLNLNGFLTGFRDKKFRAAAFGYFGHMWELYAFWVFVPVILAAYKMRYPDADFSVPLLSFLIIASGSVACVIGGLISQRLGAKQTAIIALSTSGICCVISPLFLFNHSSVALVVFLFVWSMAVIADSPLFSTIVARNAPAEAKGTSLTIVNCIGFSITIVSIQLLNALRTDANAQYIYTLLAIGPALGLAALFRDKEGT